VAAVWLACAAAGISFGNLFAAWLLVRSARRELQEVAEVREHVHHKPENGHSTT
jgi:hypothetical protein